MTVSGNMKVKLNYAGGGQQITVDCGDTHLTVTLGDGTEFRVPVGGKGKLKAVA